MRIVNRPFRTTSQTEVARLLSYRYQYESGKWGPVYPVMQVNFTGEWGEQKLEFVLLDRFGDAQFVASRFVEDFDQRQRGIRLLGEHLQKVRQIPMFPDFQMSQGAAA